MVKLTVKPIKGDDFQIEVELTQTVKDVVAVIAKQNAEFSTITRSGQILKEGSTLADCGVKESDVLVCMEDKGAQGTARSLKSLAIAVVLGLVASFLVLPRDETGVWRKELLRFVPFLPSSSEGGGAAIPVNLAPGADGGSKKARAKTVATAPTSKPAAAKKTPLSKEVRDPATGIVFQRKKRFPLSKADLTCLGVGVRAKNLGITKVNVYSVGLYVEGKGARSALKKFADLDPHSASKDKDLFKVLGQAGGFSKYLHLIFARGVGAQRVVDAFTSVKGVDQEVLNIFAQMTLDAVGDRIAKGESVTLGWEGKDKMVLLVRDKPAGTVVDAALPKAVFDLYLGSHPVAPVAKAAFGEGVPAFLAS